MVLHAESPAMSTMQWILSAIFVCAVLATGTLGDKTLNFGFPKISHRASILERLVGGRHRSDHTEDIGGAHGVTSKDENTCTPGSKEYYRRLEALWCNKRHMQVVREEIERNNCTNTYLSSGGYTDSCPITDERDNVKVNCSEECSYRQYSYLHCKYVGEEALNIERECGKTVIGAGYCSFNNRDFCSSFLNSSSLLQTAYNECFLKNKWDNMCSNECKEAVENFKDTLGCCVRFYMESYSSVLLVLSAFYNCGVEIPEVCKSFSPPKEFLDCMHGGDLHVSPTIFYSIVLIILSLLNAV